MFLRPTSHSAALGPGCAGPPLAQYTPVPPGNAGPTLQLPLDGAEAFMVDPQMAAGALAPTKRTSWVIAVHLCSYMHKLCHLGTIHLTEFLLSVCIPFAGRHT